MISTLTETRRLNCRVLLVLYPWVVEQLGSLWTLIYIMLQTAFDEVLTLRRDMRRYFRALILGNSPLKGEVDISLTIETITPGVLPCEHFDDEAAYRPYVRLLAKFITVCLGCHPGRRACDQRLYTLQTSDACSWVKLLHIVFKEQ